MRQIPAKRRWTINKPATKKQKTEPLKEEVSIVTAQIDISQWDQDALLP